MNSASNEKEEKKCETKNNTFENISLFVDNLTAMFVLGVFQGNVERKILKWKSYKLHVTILFVLNYIGTPDSKLQAEGFLSHDVEFFSKQVIWKNEK